MDVRDLQPELWQRFNSIPWLSKSGTACPPYRSIPSVEAVYHGEAEIRYALWDPQTHRAEAQALKIISDPEIDAIFMQTQEALSPTVHAAYAQMLDRLYPEDPFQRDSDSGLYPEAIELMLCDISWCAVEQIIKQPDFFSMLLPHYERGFWPCSWDGNYPDGTLAIF